MHADDAPVALGNRTLGIGDHIRARMSFRREGPDIGKVDYPGVVGSLAAAMGCFEPLGDYWHIGLSVGAGAHIGLVTGISEAAIAALLGKMIVEGYGALIDSLLDVG